jgi:hypothetical protein
MRGRTNIKTKGRTERERGRKIENIEGGTGEARERKPEKQTDEEEHNRKSRRENKTHIYTKKQTKKT